NVADDRPEKIRAFSRPLRREVAARAATQARHVGGLLLLERSKSAHPQGTEIRVPFGACDVHQVGRHGLVWRCTELRRLQRFYPRLIVLHDLIEALRDRILREVIEADIASL